MTTVDVALPATDRYRAATVLDVIRSEWTKLRTVPSTLWTVLVVTGLGVGFGALISRVSAQAYANNTGDVRRQWDPTSISTAGGSLAQLAIGVLGALVITSEYSTGEIRGSLCAVPRRGRLLLAKMTVIAALAFVVGEVTMFAAFFSGQALIAGYAPTASLGDAGVLRALIGAGLYVALIAALGVAFGTLLRSTAAAITVLIAMIYVLPGLAALLPASLSQNIEKFWPTQAGQQVTAVMQPAHTLGPWQGLAEMAAFVAVAMAVAFVRLVRDDA